MHELLKLPVAAEHAERRVPGAEQIPGGADDLPQHHRQVQLARDQGIGAQQPPQPPLRGQHVARPVHQLHQQLIQLQPRHIGKGQPASCLRCARPARRLPDGRRRIGIARNTSLRAHKLSCCRGSNRRVGEHVVETDHGQLTPVTATTQV